MSLFNFLKKFRKSKMSNDSNNNSMCDAIIITLMPYDTTTYSNATGFFRFRDKIYYRGKKSPGRSIDDNLSFTDSIKSMFPDEFGNLISSDIGMLEVELLEFINVIK